MSFEMETQTDILTRMKEDYRQTSKEDVSIIEGTFTGDMLSASAAEFEKAYAEMALVIEAAYGTTAWGKYLTMRAEESGIIRKEATHATGELTVKGTGTVYKGAQFATEDGVIFEATETKAIVQSGTISIQAVTAGLSGNVAVGAVNTIPISIAGISTVTNEEATHDGYDEETDESLRERYLLHVRNPGTSGNKFHYLEWSNSVAGVGASKVIPTWDGPGTVKVIIVNSNYASASEELVKKVEDYIESVRPIGAMVTVVSAVPKSINIHADIIGDIDKESFEAAVREYFIDIEKKSIQSSDGEYVALAKIGSLIIEAGNADDYTGLTLNGMAENVSLNEEEIAVVGEVDLT